MTEMKICVDASVVVKWLVREDGSDQARLLLERWITADWILIAPSMLDYEIGSALRQKVIRGELEFCDLYPALDRYSQLGLQLFHLANLAFQCVSVAETLKQPSIYDTGYLMIAKQQGCDYVTADARFHKAAAPIFPMVKFYQDLV